LDTEYRENGEIEAVSKQTLVKCLLMSERCFCCTKTPARFCIPLVAKEILKMIEGEKRNSGGRPKKAVKRESATGIRFTKSEYFTIARMDEEERHFYRQLSGMSDNLNQLTKKAHQEGILTAVLLFEKYRNTIDVIIEKLRR
jgi:hypothetical protein